MLNSINHRSLFLLWLTTSVTSAAVTTTPPIYNDHPPTKVQFDPYIPRPTPIVDETIAPVDFYPSRMHERLPDAHQLTLNEKQQYVKQAMMFAWDGYRTFSWGSDENRPVSNRPVNTRNGWGATIVDGIDTLYLMGLYGEFNEARDYIANIDWDATHGSSLVQVFETTIRYVGGLLSAYELSGDEMFVEKTVELVDRLLPAFNTPTGIPYQYVNFRSGKGVKSGFPDGASCLAELGTVQLEFTRLSEITGDWTYHHIGQRVYETFIQLKTDQPGLFPHLINPDTGDAVGDYISWGGMADSFYEYLIKQHVMAGGKDTEKKDMMVQSIRSMERYLITRPKGHPELALLSDINGETHSPVMDELACFAPGNLLLAARTTPELADIEPLAFDMMHGCYNAWASTRTGIAPEVFAYMDEDGNTVVGNLTGRREYLARVHGVFPLAASYILRPETIESLFYFYRFTHDRRYQDMAWDIFNSIHTYCRANSGFSGINNVDAYYPNWDDRQESFFFAETLKYLYLIFDDPSTEQHLSLNEWVLNTEAHPFKIMDIIPPPAPPFLKKHVCWIDHAIAFLTQWMKLIFIPYLDLFNQF
ncbi:glycoside hydrolase [Phascolomyces articulosus]|uniref:alpha-1,2-Mannosidase n=1 Tax=Phascolomyces articulosus TaxID=60185 RepID=A0AAD5KJX6_9FUNG|nr:glycoside hydrolase [Phascolomyces articulosus]